MIENNLPGREVKAETAGDTAALMEQFLTGFEEFKAANEARLKELETRGAADPLGSAFSIERSLIGDWLLIVDCRYVIPGVRVTNQRSRIINPQAITNHRS